MSLTHRQSLTRTSTEQGERLGNENNCWKTIDKFRSNEKIYEEYKDSQDVFVDSGIESVNILWQG